MEKKYCYEYPRPALTTDCVIFGFDGHQLKVLLIKRGIAPFKDHWAFPGGFLRMDETLEEGALRELNEETGLKAARIEQLKAFSAVDRDERGRVITVAFYALVKTTEVVGGDDAAEAKWWSLSEIPMLAFDHSQILREAEKRLREVIHFQPVGFDLLPEVFTMPELQTLYEAILDVKFDRRNFARKMLTLELLDMADPQQERNGTRTPVRYRFNEQKYTEMKQRGFRLEF